MGDVPRLRTRIFEYPRARLKFQNFSRISDARQTNYDKFSAANGAVGGCADETYPRVLQRREFEFANSQVTAHKRSSITWPCTSTGQKLISFSSAVRNTIFTFEILELFMRSLKALFSDFADCIVST